jgi:thiol-disulfide isomerase/thioredoxin
VVAVVLLLGVVAFAGCRTPARHPAPVATAAAPAPDLSRVEVILLNGGGTAAQNYQSHLLHVRQFHDMLERVGLPADRLAVFSSDGDDPGLDLAVRDAQPETDFWLIEGSWLEAPLRTPVTFGNSTVEGAVLAPATKAELARWFTTQGRAMRAGDTLLLYVTDHGTRAKKEEPGNTGITLWGVGESISVRELGALLAELNPAVRVVTLMSQCFSGGFAQLATARSGDSLPNGETCGFFSSTADRPAYGCYPENRGRENVGHSFLFLEALAETGRLDEAHRAVLVSDATPDVPLRTSDVWLDQTMAVAAKAAGQELTPFLDALLRQAWQDPGAWETDIRLLDRIGNTYGSFSPRSIHEIDEQGERLAAASQQLRINHGTWSAAFDSARRANLDRFVATRPVWRDRLTEPKVRDLPQPAARALTVELLGELGPATRADRSTTKRFDVLREKSASAGEVAYRMDVRLGVLLRMRALLTHIAGRVWLQTKGTPAQRAAYAALRDCESFALPSAGVPPGTELAHVQPFPPLEDDLALADDVLPAWMGIQFKQAADDVRTQHQLPNGAAAVIAVYPDSPAKAAGLQAGDVVTGPPGHPFTERDQIREWTMLSRVNEPATLAVLRDGQPLQVTIRPQPMPRKWPSLSSPPKVGAAAPPLSLGAYRGTPPTQLADGNPHLLFFWATWCGVCKASLPELDAFAQERGVQVVAITDEGAPLLDPFFAKWKGPFPATVATDVDRRAFMAYGVSGMPTFVLVDGAGNVQSYAVGYNPAKGIAIDGWTWSKRPAPPAS